MPICVVGGLRIGSYRMCYLEPWEVEILVWPRTGTSGVRVSNCAILTTTRY